jgi:hypothetical protein
MRTLEKTLKDGSLLVINYSYATNDGHVEDLEIGSSVIFNKENTEAKAASLVYSQSELEQFVLDDIYQRAEYKANQHKEDEY